MPSARREYGVLALILMGLTVSTVAWTLSDRTPPAWDPSDHMRTAYDYYLPLAKGQYSGFIHEFFRVPHPYAPLFHVMTAVAFLVFHASRLAGIAVNFFSLGVLLFSVHWIGSRLYPASERTTLLEKPALIAALLSVCYPFPAWLIHDAFLDYTLMAAVTVAFAMLIRAGDFHSRKDAVIFGIVAGLGMLVKQTFPFFFILPAAYFLVRGLRRRDRTMVTNLFLAAGIAAAVASVWYIPHMRDVLAIYRVNTAGAVAEHDGPVFGARSLVYYIAVFGDLQVQLPLGFLAVAGITYSIRRRARQDALLHLWILSGVLSFTLLANKDTRYTVPILPAVALLSVSWLDRIRRTPRLIAAATIALWALASFLNAQWPSAKREIRVNVKGLPLYVFAGNTFAFDHAPAMDEAMDDWGVPEIVRTATGRLGVVPNIWQLNPSNVALYIRLNNRAGVSVDSLLDDDAPSRLEQCDYVLARTHLETAERVAPMEVVMDRYLQEHRERFKPAQVFALPLSQQAVLYERIFPK